MIGETGPRPEGSACDRGAITKISSRNLGGQRDFDTDTVRLCRCGEEPAFQWKKLKEGRGVGRFHCGSCGRDSAWESTRDTATLAWNELTEVPVADMARRRKL